MKETHDHPGRPRATDGRARAPEDDRSAGSHGAHPSGDRDRRGPDARTPTTWPLARSRRCSRRGSPGSSSGSPRRTSPSRTPATASSTSANVFAFATSTPAPGSNTSWSARSRRDPAAGRISAESPLGRALIGRRKGEVALVEAPTGTAPLQDPRHRASCGGRLKMGSEHPWAAPPPTGTLRVCRRRSSRRREEHGHLGTPAAARRTLRCLLGRARPSRHRRRLVRERADDVHRLSRHR